MTDVPKKADPSHDHVAHHGHDHVAHHGNDHIARRWHDMGGDAAGPIPDLGGPNDQHGFSMWEKRVDALMIIGSAKGYFTVDGLRRVLEDMGEDAFETMTYYERWIASVNQNLIEGGAYSTAELAEKMAQVTARGDTYGDAAHPKPAAE